MGEVDVECMALAQYLRTRRASILDAWLASVRRDPSLETGDSLPRTQLLDHIPNLLATFEREISGGLDVAPGDVASAAQQSASAHGLQRWQQGYDLREVTRELGKLNECVVAELDAYGATRPVAVLEAVVVARRLWAALCSTSIEESVGRYFQLQQQEAAGQVQDLENALVEIRDLEQQRADLWQQAAHDLRGNLGVVANATVGLAHGGLREATRDEFVRILMRNVTSLHHLLDDVTSLARLEAGREQRQVEPLDVAHLLQQLCEGIRPIAQQRRLFLRCDGPPGFAADGDAVKIRRIAQNLVLNAVKFTQQGGVTLSWGESSLNDPKRWQLCITDTGPGLPSVADRPSVAAVTSPEVAHAVQAGEGIGLSIVKRLCALLDATIEIQSERGVGTTCRIYFPRHYST